MSKETGPGIPTPINNPSTAAEQHFNDVVEVMQETAEYLGEGAENSGVLAQYHEQLGAAEVAISSEP